jgi:hypothetical protein
VAASSILVVVYVIPQTISSIPYPYSFPKLLFDPLRREDIPAEAVSSIQMVGASSVLVVVVYVILQPTIPLYPFPKSFFDMLRREDIPVEADSSTQAVEASNTKVVEANSIPSRVVLNLSHNINLVESIEKVVGYVKLHFKATLHSI